MIVSLRGLHLIEQFEGFVDHIYDDGTGVMTVGYGTTNADISPLPQHVTQQQAEQLLARELAIKYEPAVNGLGIPLNQNQYDALVSLAYNVGPGVMGWQIGRDLRARNYAAAAADFMQYVWAGGRVLQGLVNRRHAEQALFLTPAGPPPPPPDPHHYLLFAPGPERDAVQNYDQLRQHPWLHGHQLAQLEAELTRLRKLVWMAACTDGHGHQLPPKDRQWGVRNRGWRWQQLNARSHGVKVV